MLKTASYFSLYTSIQFKHTQTLITHWLSHPKCWKSGTRIKSCFTVISTTNHEHAVDKTTDLVQALHHHVGHVLIKHGRRYDDLIEGLVVPPQSRVGRLLLTTAAGREKYRQSVNQGKRQGGHMLIYSLSVLQNNTAEGGGRGGGTIQVITLQIILF